MTIGERIALLRKRKNMTQAELAKIIFVSPKTVSKWENDYGLPDIKILPELAKALEVDTDYLLTGKHRKISQTTIPEVKEKTSEPEYERGAYKLALHQVTHNHLSKWILLLNIVILVFALVFGPIDLKYKNDDNFGTITILSAIYEPLGSSLFQNGWMLAISIVWIIELLYIVVSSLIMLFATLNGTNEYYIKISAIQFVGVFALAILSCIGSWFSNLHSGEIVMRVNAFFSVLVVLTFLLFILNVFVSRHGKKLHFLKQIAAMFFAFLITVSIVSVIIPLKAVPEKLNEDAVVFSELNLSVTERKMQTAQGSWLEYEGEGIIEVCTNLKIAYIYDTVIEFDKGNYRQTMFANTKYLNTQYRNKKYYNYFKIEIIASTDYEQITEFAVYCRLIKDGKQFSINTNTDIV